MEYLLYLNFWRSFVSILSHATCINVNFYILYCTLIVCLCTIVQTRWPIEVISWLKAQRPKFNAYIFNLKGQKQVGQGPTVWTTLVKIFKRNNNKLRYHLPKMRIFIIFHNVQLLNELHWIICIWTLLLFFIFKSDTGGVYRRRRSIVQDSKFRKNTKARHEHLLSTGIICNFTV